MKDATRNTLHKRAIVQWVLAVGFIILNGILFFVTRKVAYIPFVVIPLMIISVFIWSRAFCGWACPRAAFLERIFAKVSLNKPVPKWMNYYWVSILVFVVLIGRVTYVGFTKGLLAAGFLLCIVPSIGALLFGLYSSKSWCAICPTGTILKSLDFVVGDFKVSKSKCTACGKCDKSCPMGIEPSKVASHCNIESPNCTQCGLCVESCTKELISLPHKVKKTSTIPQRYEA